MDAPDLINNYCERNGWSFLNNKSVGQGGYGYVKIACKKNNCEYVAKVLELGEDMTEVHEFEEEINIMLYLQSHDKSISPKVEEAWMCKMNDAPHGIIVMEKMDGTITNLIENGEIKIVLNDLPKIINKIEKLGKFGIIHGDLKSDNILYKKLPDGSYDYRLSDYGFSSRFENDELQNTNWLRDFDTFEEGYDLAFFLCDLKKRAPNLQIENYISTNIYNELKDKYIAPHAWPC